MGSDYLICEFEEINNFKMLEDAYNILLFISSRYIGSADKELGCILIQKYLQNLLRMHVLPKYIVLINEAVFLSLQSSNCYKILKRLQARNVEILICSESTCYFKIDNKTDLGRECDMTEIIEKQFSASKIIFI